MKKMAIASCFVALCTASSWEHPLQREMRTLRRQAKTAQTCSMFPQDQLAKCSYGRFMRQMMTGMMTACADSTKHGTPECPMEDLTCMGAFAQQCIPEPSPVPLCGGGDVAAVTEMMSKPCDKLTDEKEKQACNTKNFNEISDDCLSCWAVNEARKQKGGTEINCFGSFVANEKCTWEQTAKVMNGFTCPDETSCNAYKNSMSEDDHVCLGCVLSIWMGPKDSKGEPIGDPMSCMSAAAKAQKPCKQNQLDAVRDWGACMEPASDAKDACEKAISDSDPAKEAKEQQCDDTEKAANAACKQTWVSPDASYSNPDKTTEGCVACFMMSASGGDVGKAGMCAPPDQRCTAEDVAKVQVGYDCAATDAKCRSDASNTISGACRFCWKQNKENLDKTCQLTKVKNSDGDDETDYFKCIPALKLCDVEDDGNGKVLYKPTPTAPPMPKPPTAPPVSPGNPPTAPPATPKRKYRKLRAMLKLAKKKVKQSMKEWCNDQSEPKRCKKIGKELANKVFKALKKNLGALYVTSVVVTHLCKLVGAATEITDAQKNDPTICQVVGEISDAGRMARFLQTADAEGDVTAVYETTVDDTVAGTTMTGVVDKAQADGSLSVTDPVGGEDVVTGGDGTVGTTTDLGPADPPSDDDDGSDIGMILGIIFGCLAALGLVAFAAVIVSSRKKAAQFSGAPSNDSPAPMYHQSPATKSGRGQI